ncbi:MAG: helix-turn-helix domain-containing protein [Armatimonadota bacterium]
MIPDRLLTIKEVAAILHVHEKTVRRRIKANELKAITNGRIVRIHPSEVKCLILSGMSVSVY